VGKRGLALLLILVNGAMLAGNHYLHETRHIYYRMPLVICPAGVLCGLLCFAFPDVDPRARWAHVVAWIAMGIGLACSAWLMSIY
jgi:hypothetical protein